MAEDEKSRPTPQQGGFQSLGPGKVTTPESRPKSHSLTSGHLPQEVTSDITTIQPVDWDELFQGVKESAFPATYVCAWHECETEIPKSQTYCSAHECTVKDCGNYGAFNGICDVHEYIRKVAIRAVQKDRLKRPASGIKSQNEENEIAYRRAKARRDAEIRIAEETGQVVTWDDRVPDTWEWLTSENDQDVPMWGTKENPIWMPGESLLISGPSGIGKSTLAHALVWGSLGLIPDVLGFPVPPMEDGGILYLAMDRPEQIKRAMARFIRTLSGDEREAAREALKRFMVWPGPLPGDIRKDKQLLVKMAEEHGATRIVVDSIKDVLPDASQEENAGGYNLARQEALQNGIQWVELHHNRKSNGDNKAPNTLADVYGSTWLTSGAGSVISLFGQPGDIVTRLTHLKSPFEPINPMWVQIDPPTGTISRHEELTPLMVIQKGGTVGVTAQEVTAEIYGVDLKEVSGKEWKSKVQNIRNQISRLISIDKFENEGQIRYRQKGELMELDKMI